MFRFHDILLEHASEEADGRYAIRMINTPGY